MGVLPAVKCSTYLFIYEVCCMLFFSKSVYLPVGFFSRAVLILSCII